MTDVMFDIFLSYENTEFDSIESMKNCVKHGITNVSRI